MKSVLIIVSVLVVMTTVYSFNESKLRKFSGYLEQCSKESGVPPTAPNGETLFCALQKDNKVDEKNELMKEASLLALADVISDAERLKQARELFTKCYDEAVQSGSTGQEQAIQICTCSLPGLALFDKLQ